MPGTALADALDYLVTETRALSECEAPVVVSDGFPVTDADIVVAIGVTNEDGASELDADWAGLGAGREDETFDIPCLIDSYAGGTNQSIPRRAAVVVLDAIAARIRQDRSLGGALNSPGLAAIRDVRLVQTSTAEEAADGRYARIYFNVRCTSRF